MSWRKRWRAWWRKRLQKRGWIKFPRLEGSETLVTYTIVSKATLDGGADPYVTAAQVSELTKKTARQAVLDRMDAPR